MKNFIKIFNALASIDTSPSQVTGVSQPDNCCLALEFFNPETIFFKKIADLRGQANSLSKLDFKNKYVAQVFRSLLKFVDYYCLCQQDPTASSCADQLTNKITNVRTMNNWMNQLEVKYESNPGFVRTLQVFLDGFTEYVNAAIELPILKPEFTITVRTDTLKNFLDDMCSMKGTVGGAEQFETIENMCMVQLFDSVVMDRLISEDYLASQVSAQEAQPALINCPPSANDNTIGALAAALGVSAAFVAVALAALRRGKTKQCSDVAVTARNLTPLLISATGASFATTQTSEATVQERLQAVLQKDCEGRLPYSCGEGGFEGPDGGDAGGEVDAPGGGGGIGGDLL